MKRTRENEEDVVYVDEDGNPIDFTEGDEYTFVEEVDTGSAGGLSTALNRTFHHLDRGGTLGGELGAGFLMGLLAVCVLFVNMQVIGNFLNQGVELANSPQNAANINAAMEYARLYAGAVIVSALGTLAIGIAADLPLVQVSVLGLSGAFLCLAETQSGLTYENMLFVNLLAGVVYAVVAFVPAVRNALRLSVPASVRRGLPVAVGLMSAWGALRISGLFDSGVALIGGGKGFVVPTGFSLDGTTPIAAFAGCIVALGVYVAARLTRKGSPTILALLLGTVAYFVCGIALGGVDTASTGSVANFGRIWLVAGSQASAATPFADSYLTYAPTAISAVFSGLLDVLQRGADFSAYSGSVPALVVAGIVCYLCSALAAADGTFSEVAKVVGLGEDANDTKDVALGRALMANAATNVAAPFLGMGGITLGVTGVAGAQGRGKSGLSSVVAAIVLLISLFVMAFPALLATDTYPVGSMNQWNYFAYGNGGFVYLVQAAAFAVADVVIACVGVSMALEVRRLPGIGDVIVSVLMAIGATVTLNLAVGVALGLVASIIVGAVSHEGKREVKPATIVLGVILVAAVAVL